MHILYFSLRCKRLLMFAKIIESNKLLTQYDNWQVFLFYKTNNFENEEKILICIFIVLVLDMHGTCEFSKML